MVGTVQWDFEHTTELNEQLGSDIRGQYGYAINLGSTPEALDKILKKFRQVYHGKYCFFTSVEFWVILIGLVSCCFLNTAVLLEADYFLKNLCTTQGFMVYYFHF